MRGDRPGAQSRLEELLEEFLAETADAREAWLYARPRVTDDVALATREMLDDVDAGSVVDPPGLRAIPVQARQALASAGLYRLWGTQGPPELGVYGNEPVVPERRRRVLALLRMGVECETREEGAEILDRLLESASSIPGLDVDFSCWLYLLAPTVFPPLPVGLFPNAGELVAGTSTVKEIVRRIWAFGDQYRLLLETEDLAVPTAFFHWLSTRGAEAWARPRATGPYYGADRLVHETMLAPSFVDRLSREIETSRLLLFSGPSGTGKTFTALRFARYLVRDGGAYQVLRAHPGLGYSEMVGYPPTPGVLLQLAAAAERDPAGTYVLYIDSIDQLDLDTVLGDIVLSLEYPEEPLTTAGGFRFLFPPNLYLLATARKPWEVLLRESYSIYRLCAHARFGPDPLKLAEYFDRQGTPVKSVDLVHIFRKLNRLLAERTNDEFQLGHGYLMVDGLNDGNLAAFWDAYVLPYLESSLAGRRLDHDMFRLNRLT